MLRINYCNAALEYSAQFAATYSNKYFRSPAIKDFETNFTCRSVYIPLFGPSIYYCLILGCDRWGNSGPNGISDKNSESVERGKS